jgi:hypothetical protein
VLNRTPQPLRTKLPRSWRGDERCSWPRGAEIVVDGIGETSSYYNVHSDHWRYLLSKDLK